VGNGSVNGEAAGPGQLYPLPIVTSGTMGWGAGQSAKPLGFWAEEAPKRGGREGREQEAKRGSQDLCVCVCVCVCVCPGGGGGTALTELPCPPAPVQACFLPKLLMSLQLQKPGDL
jgi:hypothetical protein